MKRSALALALALLTVGFPAFAEEPSATPRHPGGAEPSASPLRIPEQQSEPQSSASASEVSANGLSNKAEVRAERASPHVNGDGSDARSDVPPPYHLLPPADENGFRVLSPERQRLVTKYRRQGIALPILVMASGAVPVVIAYGLYDFAGSCINVMGSGSCTGRDPGPEITAVSFAIAASGLAVTAMGGVWLYSRLENRGKLREQLQRLDREERFRVERVGLAASSSGGALLMSASF